MDELWPTASKKFYNIGVPEATVEVQLPEAPRLHRSLGHMQKPYVGAVTAYFPSEHLRHW